MHKLEAAEKRFISINAGKKSNHPAQGLGRCYGNDMDDWLLCCCDTGLDISDFTNRLINFSIQILTPYK